MQREQVVIAAYPMCTWQWTATLLHFTRLAQPCLANSNGTFAR